MIRAEYKAYHDLADDFTCLSCGEDNSKVWNKADGLFPKCGNDITYSVIGEFKLKWELKQFG
mgnify:CR=1 FL=1